MTKAPAAVDGLSYEQSLIELEAILNTLENENRDLEATMALYERGRALIKRCQELLEKAELRVKVLGEEGQTIDMEENS
ncbi:MAG: exodeoxyribonuclease VII small subunit [Chloroflexi bacterium]|nr:exodeoxyribonuclease VII small subunit [Chloroflexota bacterium]